LTAIRHNPPLHASYQRPIGRGRPANVAITACMRKLLVILNAILRDQTPWQNA
jgi:transposase